MSSYRLPRRGARWARSSRLVNPLGSSLKAHRAESRAWTRSSVKRRPGPRVPAGAVAGAVIAVVRAAPARGVVLGFLTARQPQVVGVAHRVERGECPFPVAKS